MPLGFVAATRNARADAITTRAGGSARLAIFSGTRPATGGAATTELARLTCNATFAPSASAGVLTLNSITTANATATGTASWFRLFQTDGTTIVFDGDVAVSGGDLNLNTLSIVSGGPVAISSFVLTESNA